MMEISIDGQSRPVIRDVYPNIESGLYSIKRVEGESVNVWADVIADGHDIVRSALQFKHETESVWESTLAKDIGNDRFHASFEVKRTGIYEYRFIAWIDYALYWQYSIEKKIKAGQTVEVELEEGIEFLDHLLKVADVDSKAFVEKAIEVFRKGGNSEEAISISTGNQLKYLFEKYPFQPKVSLGQILKVTVDRKRAGFSTWYELFPRSTSTKQNIHGTFNDLESLLPRIAEFGFDVLYLPPIHPIGITHRKGKNNTTIAKPEDVGSCWGIGNTEGGHDTVNPLLGRLADFKSLIVAAQKLGIEIAMDFALQASPDHPYVLKYPNWFKQRPDGTIQYAENPPKKYQDIYPFYFESEDWESMWFEFRRVAIFWVENGIRIFRVDNPHTKPILFWKWLIAEVKKVNNDVIFLSEAFTKPKLMLELARAGFTQSYTYFTWRTGKHELTEYMNELVNGPVSETFRPNFWPNTPDILPFHLQNPHEPMYRLRYFLAATLSSNCGVYGPVYELMNCHAIPGKEEYDQSEKFELKVHDWQQRNSITQLYTELNRIRKQYNALQQTNNIKFVHVENDQLLAYLKLSQTGEHLLCVANLDTYNKQAAYVHFYPNDYGIHISNEFQVHDLLTKNTYQWSGSLHYVELKPQQPFHILLIKSDKNGN